MRKMLSGMGIVMGREVLDRVSAAKVITRKKKFMHISIDEPEGCSPAERKELIRIATEEEAAEAETELEGRRLTWPLIADLLRKLHESVLYVRSLCHPPLQLLLLFSL